MAHEYRATTHLLFARHGQTQASQDDVFCGTTEVPLTAKGREQAQCLAERLRQRAIDAVYCSPQGRARETAMPIAQALGREIQIRTALREMNFGSWEGRSRAELTQEYPREMAWWESGSWMVRLPNGETQQEVITRAVLFLLELLATQAGKTILLVGHRTTTRLLLGHLLNMSLPDSRSLRLDTASVSEFHITNDQVQLVYYNDTSHLVSSSCE